MIPAQDIDFYDILSRNKHPPPALVQPIGVNFDVVAGDAANLVERTGAHPSDLGPGMGAATGYFFGRIASAVPWMNAMILVTSLSDSLPVKSGIPLSLNGPLNTMSLRLAISSAGT